LRNRQSGVSTFQRLPTDALPVSFGGEARFFGESIDDFAVLSPDVMKQIRKGLKVMCREIKMGVAAAQHAIHDSGIKMADVDRDRIGVVFGSDYISTAPDEFSEAVRACMQGQQFLGDRWGTDGIAKVTPLWLLKYLPNMPACHVAIYNDLQGPNNSITVREASSNLAVGEAFSTIMRGHADIMLAGATGSRIHPLRTIHMLLQEQLAVDVPDPAAACRPFDRNRRGAVLGEGAAVIVMEELEHARRRNARPLAEVVGHGSSCVMQQDGTVRRDMALRNAMVQALRQAKIGPQQVGHVHAHGLGSFSCDRDEATTIKKLFGDYEVSTVAAKGNFGNLGAASGLVELVASVMALREGFLFPARNFEEPDPDCPVSVVTDDQTPAGEYAINVNVTPQGQASAVVVRKVA
jgi:3-oxoacyl-[acyl-carrier-protein] synthase II